MMKDDFAKLSDAAIKSSPIQTANVLQPRPTGSHITDCLWPHIERALNEEWNAAIQECEKAEREIEREDGYFSAQMLHLLDSIRQLKRS